MTPPKTHFSAARCHRTAWKVCPTASWAGQLLSQGAPILSYLPVALTQLPQGSQKVRVPP